MILKKLHHLSKNPYSVSESKINMNVTIHVIMIGINVIHVYLLKNINGYINAEAPMINISAFNTI